MEDALHQQLMAKIKRFEETLLQVPPRTSQNKHAAYEVQNRKNKYQLLINRKGHLNKDNFTLIFTSQVHRAILVRFDVNGASHINKADNSYKEIPTPHLHIFNEKHYDGKIAIHISELSNLQFINEIEDSLDFFLRYNEVETANLNIAMESLF